MRRRWVNLLLIAASSLLVQLPLSTASATSPGKFTGRLAVVHNIQNSAPSLELYNNGKYGNPAVTIPAALPTDKIESPAWSPDGSQIAFMLNENVYSANADGTNVHQVSHVYIDPTAAWYPCFTPSPACDPPAGVTWSPDGKQLAFTTQQNFYVINADGSGLKQIGYGRGRPSWSINNEIAFYDQCWINGYGGYQICIVNPDGSNLHGPHDNDFTQSYGLPDWSPDGNKLVFMGSNFSTVPHVEIVSGHDPTITQVPWPTGVDGTFAPISNPVWTPDGNAITYESTEGMYPFTDTIYMQNLTTNTATVLLSGSAGNVFVDPAWQSLNTPPAPVDNNAPKVSITKATNNTKVKTQWTFIAKATDNIGVVKVEYYVSNQNGAWPAGTATTSPYSVTWDSGPLANGIYKLQAKAVDAAGNIGSSSTRSIYIHAH